MWSDPNVYLTCLRQASAPEQVVRVPKTLGHWVEFPGWWVTVPLSPFSFLLSHPHQNNIQIILNSTLPELPSECQCVF